MKTKLITSCGVLLTLAAASVALAAEPTAFNLAKEGNRYIGEQSKDKIVQIRSERSVGTLTPNIWYVVYYDPDAPLKAIEVKFVGGQKMDVSRPLRLLEPITGNDRVLDQARLKIDSDQALKIAGSQPLTAKLTVTSAQLWLEHGTDGPRWKVRLWASRLDNLGSQVEIGDIDISAFDGSVISNDLHPNSAT